MHIAASPVQDTLQSQRPMVLSETTLRSSVCDQQNPPEVTGARVVPIASPEERPDIAHRTHLVGRESDLLQLQNIFERAFQGERQVVFVTGEAGIGKTTLVDAFLTRLRDHADVRVTAGQCVEHYGPGEAYLPLLEATMRLCRMPGREQRIEGLKRYAPSWLAQLPGLLEPQAFAQLHQRVQGASRERMLREMAEAAELFTTTRTLVLVLEDLHWSDVSTLNWMSYMARRREPAKLLILGAYRPADVLASNHPLHGIVQELQARGQCEELRLTPFAEEAISEYLAVRLKTDMGTQRAAPLQQLTPVLHRRTGGNPLFIVNTVDDLIRQGVLAEEAGQWTLHTDAIETLCEHVPDSLRQLIDQQLERLSEPEQRLLEVASVAGMEFSAAEAAAGLLTDCDEIEAQCERLARMGQWIQETGVAEWPDGTLSGRYSFRHALYHEVVYARVAEARRLQLHRRIAERKEAAYGERVGAIAAELAMRFEAGRDYQRAVEYLTRAGETALQRSAHAEAERHLTTALSLLTTLPDSLSRVQQELRVQVALGALLVATKGYAAPEVEATYLRASALCQQIPETPYLFPSLWGLWAVYAVRPDHRKALELGEQLLALTQQRNDAGVLVQAHWAVGQPLVYLGRFSQAQEHFEQGWTLYASQQHGQQQASVPRAGQDPGVNCLAMASRTLWALGYPDQALKKSYAALTLAQNLKHPLSVGFALALAAMTHHLRREGPEAQEKAEAAIALCQKHGFAFYLAVANIWQGWALAEQGQAVEGVVQLRQGLTAWRATGAEMALSHYLAALAEACRHAGQIEESEMALAEGFSAAATHEESFHQAELYRLKGELTLQQENQKAKMPNPQSLTPSLQAEAEECFCKAIDIARQLQAKSLELRAVMSLARLWQQQDKVDNARELLQEIYDWFTEGFETKDLQEAAALLHECGQVTRTEEEKQKAKLKRQKPVLSAVEGVKIGAESQKDKRVGEWETERQGHALSAAQPSALSPQPLSSPTPNPQPPAPHTFRLEGEYWTVSFADMTCRLKEARGLHYLAHLLQQPHREIHVLTLISISADLSEGPAEIHPFQDPSARLDHVEGFGDAGAILDPQARAAYKQRLSELREELAEAQEFHDLGRSEQLAAEIDFLTHELTSAVGLGGRARRMGSPAERARVNITRAIKLALRKISEHHPALGQHFATTVKTGVYCSYTPDVRLPITWQV